MHVTRLDLAHVLQRPDLVHRHVAGEQRRRVRLRSGRQVGTNQRVQVELDERPLVRQQLVERILQRLHTRLDRVLREIQHLLFHRRIGHRTGRRHTEHERRHPEDTGHLLHREPTLLQHLRVGRVHRHLRRLHTVHQNGRTMRPAQPAMLRLPRRLHLVSLLLRQLVRNLQHDTRIRTVPEEPARILLQRQPKPQRILRLLDP